MSGNFLNCLVNILTKAMDFQLCDLSMSMIISHLYEQKINVSTLMFTIPYKKIDSYVLRVPKFDKLLPRDC